MTKTFLMAKTLLVAGLTLGLAATFMVILPATQSFAQVNGGTASTQTDTTLWNKTFGNVVSGNHTITLVTYEPSGRSVIKRYAGYAINTGHGLGLGDTNFDNAYSGTDASTFETALTMRISIVVSVISAAPSAILRTRCTSSSMPGRSRARIE